MEAQVGDLSFLGDLGRRLLEAVTLELCEIGKGVHQVISLDGLGLCYSNYSPEISGGWHILFVSCSCSGQIY